MIKILARSAAIALFAALWGCASIQSSAAGGGGGPAFSRAALQPEYKKALQAFEKNNPTLAVSIAENLIDRYPAGAPEKAELLFIQSKSHAQLRNAHDARESAKEYLKLFPSGPRAAELERDVIGIEAAQARPNPAEEKKLLAAKDNLESLLALEKEHPADPKVKYYAGNALYLLGRYDEAGKYYFQAQALEAAFKEKELVQKRLVINAEGKPEVRTPEAVRALERDQSPLVVFDQTNYYARDDAFSGKQVYANMTGKVRNQGSKPVNVELEVRFVNALNQILDVQVIQIGALNPNDVRPFLAQARNFDNVMNIARVEVFPRVKP